MRFVTDFNYIMWCFSKWNWIFNNKIMLVRPQDLKLSIGNWLDCARCLIWQEVEGDELKMRGLGYQQKRKVISEAEQVITFWWKIAQILMNRSQ